MPDEVHEAEERRGRDEVQDLGRKVKKEGRGTKDESRTSGSELPGSRGPRTKKIGRRAAGSWKGGGTPRTLLLSRIRIEETVSLTV